MKLVKKVPAQRAQKPAANEPLVASEGGWRPVVMAADCKACDCCGEPVCETCQDHYSDCMCPGPHQDDEYEYKEQGGRLFARPLGHA